MQDDWQEVAPVANPGEFPWHVDIIIYFPDGVSKHCGGTLVSEQHVLTATFCFEDIITGAIGINAEAVIGLLGFLCVCINKVHVVFKKVVPILMTAILP